jgi:hypothetical protein
MNQPLQQLRFLEIAPAKLAVMAAMERALAFDPPSFVRNEQGLLAPTDDIETKLGMISLRQRDDQLDRQCAEFLQACRAVDEAWQQSSAALTKKGASNITRDDIVSEYKQHGGLAHIERLRVVYMKLSAAFEAAVRREQ